MVRLSITDNIRIRRIRGGPIVVLANAVDFVALVFPSRKQITRKYVADGVVHHVQVVEDVRDLWVFCREIRT